MADYPKSIPASDVVKALLDQPGNKDKGDAWLREHWLVSEKFILTSVYVGLPDLGVTPDKPGKFVTEAPILVDGNKQGIARGAGGVGDKAPKYMVLDGQNRTTAARKQLGPLGRLQAYVGDKILSELQKQDRVFGELGKGLEPAKEQYLASAEMPGMSPGSLWGRLEEFRANGLLTDPDMTNLRAEWQRRKTGTVACRLLDSGNMSIASRLIEVNAGVIDHPGSHVGIFMRIPSTIGSQFPPRGGDDNSAPHCTVLYIGDVDPSRKDELTAAITKALQGQDSFEAALAAEADYFPPSDHSDGKKVAIMPIESAVLHAINKKLLRDIAAAGFKIKNSFPDYKPHATLEYLEPPKETFDGKPPAGRWPVKSLELWGFDTPVTFKLGA